MYKCLLFPHDFDLWEASLQPNVKERYVLSFNEPRRMTSQSSDDDTDSYFSTPSGTASHRSTPSGTDSHRSTPPGTATPSVVFEEPNDINEGRGNSMPDEPCPQISGLTSAYTERQWQSMSYTRRVEAAHEGLREACNTELVGGNKLIDWIEEQRRKHRNGT